MNKKIILGTVLALLVLISMMQALSLNGLKSELKEVVDSSESGSAVKSSTGTTEKRTTVPSNIKDLPQMVGGC